MSQLCIAWHFGDNAARLREKLRRKKCLCTLAAQFWSVENLEHPDKNGKELDKRNGYIMIYKRYVLMFFDTFFSSSSCWVSTGMGMLFHMTGV